MNYPNRRLPPFRQASVAAITFVALWAVFVAPAPAQVKDAADYFSESAEKQASELIERIRQTHGKDVVVETVPAVPGAPAPGPAREEFFQNEVSRRGKEAGVNGVYILVSRKPESFYVGVDPATQERAFTLKDRGRVRDQLLSRFKAKDFDGGIVSALQSIDQTLAANASGGATSGGDAAAGAGATAGATSGAAAEGSTPPAGPGPAPTPRTGMNITSWLCLIIGALAIFMIVRGIMSRRTMGRGGYGPHATQPGYDPRTGQPLGQPGFDPRYQQQGGGGFGRGILGGLLGGMAGGYLYDQMRGQGGAGNEAQAATPPPMDPNTTPLESTDTTSGFADFGSGGDAGGGDFGGGDFGGGDFGE